MKNYGFEIVTGTVIVVVLSETLKFTTVPSDPAHEVLAVTANWPSVVSVVVESVTRLSFEDATTVYLALIPPDALNVADCPCLQLKVADEGFTTSPGAGRVALHVPAPSEPVLVYVPSIDFQSSLNVPVKVVVLPSELSSVIEILFPSRVPVSVALSDVVPEKSSYLCSCVIEIRSARAVTLDAVRTKFQVPLTSPSPGKVRNVPPQL